MVMGLNPVTTDTLNLPSASCCGWLTLWGLGPHREFEGFGHGRFLDYWEKKKHKFYVSGDLKKKKRL